MSQNIQKLKLTMMNKLYKPLFLAALTFICTFARAYDFEAGGLYYNIMSVSDRTVEVTYQDQAYTATEHIILPQGQVYVITAEGCSVKVKL